MLINEIKKYFEGRVYFTASEGFSETFINACKGSGAYLRDIFVSGDSVKASVKYSQYKRVLIAAQVSGMNVEATKKTGFPATVGRYKTRLGIPAGILLAAVIIQILSGMLWSVEVQGLESIKEEDFFAFLDECGVKKGMFLINVDCGEIELRSENYSPAIMRVTANLIGSKLYVDVYERTAPPEIADGSVYGNIVASKDGEVLSADILAGVPYVKAGDAVLKGDVLAGGVQELSDGSTRLLRAQARVRARTKTTLSCRTALKVSVQKPDKLSDSTSLYFFGIVFPPLKEASYCAEYLSTPSSVFPIGLLRARTTRFSDVGLTLSEARAKLICVTDLAYTAFETLGDTKVEHRELSSTVDGQYAVDATFYCEEDIAEEQLFEMAE